MGIYYGNLWDALKFPFLSQELFSSNSSSTAYEVYNQSVRKLGLSYLVMMFLTLVVI